MPRSVKAVLFLLLLVAIWLPRGLALDQFATPDEAAWVGRSAAFYHALAQRDYPQTFQHGHPGVTLTWAGTLAYRWRYPAIAWEAGQTVLKNWKNVEPFLHEHAVRAVDILEASRLFVVLGNTLALAVAFIYALRLVGFFPALLGFVLIALDPFFIGLARLLHLDGLVSSLMLLSLLAFMAYLYRGRRGFDLLVAGVAAGLSWLTRSPALFLGLFFGLLLLAEILKAWQVAGRLSFGAIWISTWPILAWTAIGALVFAALWPAMWVDPLGVLGRMFGQAFSYATEGHDSVVFFNGEIIAGDPGWLFYPLTYLWRTTPVILVGLALAGLGFIFEWPPFKSGEFRRSALILALFAILFGLAMTLGAKKFDRYLLPSYGPLVWLAALDLEQAHGLARSRCRGGRAAVRPRLAAAQRPQHLSLLS
jgi:4-amino-4-deoxy-L-arabinose transferase-like glycosyltransferase